MKKYFPTLNRDKVSKESEEDQKPIVIAETPIKKRKNDSLEMEYMLIDDSKTNTSNSTVDIRFAKSTKKCTTKSDGDDAVKRAINLGINVTFGKDLKDVEKSAYRPWGSKEPVSLNQSRPHPKGLEGSLQNITFVFTGDLPSFSREDCTDIVKRYGGRITSAVSSKTTFLVTGNDPGSSKISKAKQMNTAVLDEDSFIALIESYLDSNNSKDIKASDPQLVSNISSKVQQNCEANKTNTFNVLVGLEIEDHSTKKKIISPKPDLLELNAQKNQPQNLKKSPEPSNLWVDKYKPKNVDEICGNKKQISDLTHWLQNWHPDLPKGERAALISGFPGIGKTTTAHIISKSLGKDIIELNASDARNKESVKKLLGTLSGNHTILEYTDKNIRKHNKLKLGNTVIIMDEVDGMSAGDRGGTAELIKIINETKIPIICICNDRMSTKVRSLANYCVDIKFFKPQARMLRSRILSICHIEGLRIDPNAADQLAESTNSDMRQILNILSIWKLSKSVMTFDDGKKFSSFNKKEFSVGPFEVIGQYLNFGQFKSLNLQDKINLYFNDFSIMPLMIHENYMTNVSALAGSLSVDGEVANLMMLSKAAESIAEGDILSSVINSSQNWGLLPNHAVMSCVRPAHFISGRHHSMYTFPSWLGKNSTTTKNLRQLSEISSQMRSKASAGRNQILTSYLPTMALKLTLPLINQGIDGIPEVIDFMDEYNITREDWDAVNDLILTPSGRKQISSRIETKVRSAFTRQYNKTSHKTKSTAKAIFGAEGSNDFKPDAEDAQLKKKLKHLLQKPKLLLQNQKQLLQNQEQQKKSK
ncbi:hypothetical protein BB561_001559 [Smittium simulii]|uniref:Replication factor C subunit 1 n=1 Tax=Smittium simulii TaxID=133385 RepID=A0A2T9YU87_9FUNG|nr:hypothetical protein BB561_001559 [Smittium simulii]